MDDADNEENAVLEADTVFLLMKKGFPISRKVRAQWVIEHLETLIKIQHPNNRKNDEIPELEVASVLPCYKPSSWNTETSYRYVYKVTASTSVIFLAHKYRIVFNLDLSPSLATVDIQHGEIVIDEVSLATRRCLESITRPFLIPGSDRVMQPEIYVTVIAHTPFFTSPAQQVLIQGMLVTMENVNYLMQVIEKQLNLLEERVAEVTGIVNQQLETLRAESERLVGGLFEEGGTCVGKSNNNSIANISMVSPEASFINMLRYGMLALTLLPEHSCSHLIVVTDGIVGVTDVHVLDSIVQQLRATTVACSFLHVGSSYHPHSANGLVPYQDLLCFIAMATLGNYMTFVPQPVPGYDANMNVYHQNFLCWKLYRNTSYEFTSGRSRDWHTENSFFNGHEPPQLLRKKQIDEKVTCTLSSLLCCRLREGYLIKKLCLRDGFLEISFVLPWKTHVFLEYFITCPYPMKSSTAANAIQYTITIEAPYEFLHDITCLSKKPLKSQYRQSVVSRFWTALTSLTESDNMLSHFSWFPGSGWTWYSVPDTVRNGMPVFYLPAYPSPTAVQLSDAACPQFGQIWQPVVSLEPLHWARWMHSQRLTLILSHDKPLPRHLHQANQSGRFQCVQCRQAAAALYAMLKSWATFVLVENHTYVQFIYREADKPPVSFSLIRITCKALCVVLNVAFAGGTEGVVRHNVVVDLVERLSNLSLPNRPTEQRETPCCIIIHKALERILIRYERMPTDLSTVVFPDGTQPITTARSATVLGGSLTTTLSRYLYHSRWLWLVRKPLVQTIPGIVLPRLNITAIARILSTITKIRLAEGFSFAYSAAGIINMVLEVQMKGAGNDTQLYPCIIQYILFPPHMIINPTWERDSGSEEDTDDGTGDGEAGVEDGEGSGDFQIVTEVWIEPQYGKIQMPIHPKAAYMHSLMYRQLPDAIARIDEECINALLTLEHLSLLSQVIPDEKNVDIYIGQDPRLSDPIGGRKSRQSTPEFFNHSPIIDDRIHSKLFTFDTLNILPKCQQAELLYSMFANGSRYCEERENASRLLMEGLLEHIKCLHSKELLLTAGESQRFTQMLACRPREEGAPFLFLSQEGDHDRDEDEDSLFCPRWRCFVKGISVTHVIVTIIPNSERDVQSIMFPEEDRPCSVNENCDLQRCTPISSAETIEKNSTPIPWTKSSREYDPSENAHLAEIESIASSRTTTAQSTPKVKRANSTMNESSRQGSIVPIYVYDCSLALLMDALVEKLPSPRIRDIYQDHTFRIGQETREDFVNLKPGNDTKPSSPEPKSEDSDNISSDQRSLMEHCKLLSLAHCHSYVVAIYKSLALQQPLSYEDMEAAVEQCEEALIEINITNYLKNVCKHLKHLRANCCGEQSETFNCNDVKPFHNLIREKFEKIITAGFRPVPAHPEFYFFSPSWNSERMNPMDSQRTDSDDEMEDFAFQSEINDCLETSSGKGNQDTAATWPGTTLHEIAKLPSCDSTESLISDLNEDKNNSKEHPLFLQLRCSIHNPGNLSSTSVKLLPTCFKEILNELEDYEEQNSNDPKITLDIIRLNLPRDVLEVSLERSHGLRTTSYSSASPVGSMRTNSESSPGNETEPEPQQERDSNLPLYQHNAIVTLRDEIEWLLQDETATALLDDPTPTEETLKFVASHVSHSNGRSSCSVDKVPLHFVFPSESSAPRFLEELSKLEIDRYCIQKQGGLFYFVKKTDDTGCAPDKDCTKQEVDEREIEDDDVIRDSSEPEETQDQKSRTSRQDSGDLPCYSEISSVGEEQAGTDDGYEGDSSNTEDDCHWLIELDNRRAVLPNFWLILKVEANHVNVFFHCRFLELASTEVDRYRQTQKQAVAQIKAICRRVNQYLLLQSLYNTRMCDSLLEPESNEDHSWRGDSGNETVGAFHNQNSGMNMTPGIFRCPIVWEAPFYLHPRLKTGPGRSGLSRGIKALHGVLNRFSVNNRNNMFVHQERNGNVFYLRLHEHTSDGKTLQNKLSESDEKLVVSRSSSIASLSHPRGGMGLLNDQSSGNNDTRPRVRSFGEKESDILNKTGDTIVLMVHGISEAGPEVQCDLVQVLQNRLDDAVLEVLSVMLARNPMCKLTPADVHFIQRPYKSPECVVRLSLQPHCLPHMNALGYYLRQNLLQFLYIPKYTDYRAHYHFQDYSQPEGSSKRVSESDIFLYNQSHSSGSKGIACIARAIVLAKGDDDDDDHDVSDEQEKPTIFREPLSIEDFESVVSTAIYESNCTVSETLVEFRIWKQGRVNLEALKVKLKAAVKHSTWDLVTEYKLLPTVLAEPLPNAAERSYIESSRDTPMKLKNHQTKSGDNALVQLSRFELGEDGKLHDTYRVILPAWFQFALENGVPAVKKHVVSIQRRHPIPVIVRELQNLVRGNAGDTSTRTFVLRKKQPFISTVMASKRDLESKDIGDGLEWLDKEEHDTQPTYVPCDFTKEDHETYIQSILIGRNFDQWKASFSQTTEPELLVPKDPKLLQKFNPLIMESSFVPRQRLLLAKVESNSIVMYMYNWSKEKSEVLSEQTLNLGTWLSSRSNLLSNIIMQKLGIFHYQPMRNYQADDPGLPQYYHITDIESLTKFPHASHVDNKEWPRPNNRTQTGKSPAINWNHLVSNAMRDAKPSTSHINTTDPVVKAAYDIQDLRQREKKSKEDLNRLYAMWQSRSSTPNIPISLTTLNTFKQHSRLIHYCHTPLLFLPSWRLQSAATRDHSITPPPSTDQSNFSDHHLSHNNLLKITSPDKVMTEWHQELCASMLCDYKQYLQILGFNPIQVETPRKTDGKKSQQQYCYLKKSMLGGVLVFEIHLAEPFFIAKLRIIECSRLQTKTSSALVNQFMLSFVDACDKIKINMHLHSFTYDFHLRCIHSYIAGTGHWSLQHGYHLTHFLDDFNKYYSKAPNYARNLVYSDTITVNNLATPARTLYSYLLSHEKTYGMQVFGMSNESQDSRDSEYVLVTLQSTPLVSYCDAQDMKYTDDFDIALIVSRVEQTPQAEQTEITLKYYLMLTSKRELFPKREVENNKLGKFRTVYSVVRLSNNSNLESPAGSSPVSPIPPFLRKLSRTEVPTSDSSESCEDKETTKEATAKSGGPKSEENGVASSMAPTPPPVPNSPLTQNQSILNATSSTNLVQIRQESVNYLGYYSSHEQVMQQMIMSQAEKAREHISNMIECGALHCRTHLLWNRLLENRSAMSYVEFTELCSLAHVESLSTLDPRLSPLVNQPVAWYQALAKVLQNKYQELHKQFVNPDGNVTHHLILHPSFLQAFMMLTIDLHTYRGELHAVYRKSAEVANAPFSTSDLHSLIEGFVNACCFHLWVGLCNQ